MGSITITKDKIEVGNEPVESLKQMYDLLRLSEYVQLGWYWECLYLQKTV